MERFGVVPVQREDSVRGTGIMLVEQHVASGHEDGTGRHVLIIGDEDPPLASVNLLVGLQAETTHVPPTTDGSALEGGSHRVGGVLDHANPESIAQLPNRTRSEM